MAQQRIIKRTFKNDLDDKGVEIHEAKTSPIGFVTNLVYVIATALELLLFIRLALSLAGANGASQFANFIYNFTAPFVAPFRGMFSVNSVVGRNSRFEFETLVAMVVYALLAAVIIMLIRAFDTTTDN